MSGPSFKFGLSFLLLYSTSNIFLLHLSLANHFLQNRHCYCSTSFQLKIYFSTDPEPIRIHRSRLINIVKFFSIWTIKFCYKIKYNNSRVYCSYCTDENVADQCVSQRSNLEHFNWCVLRHSCRVHIFCRRDNQSSWPKEAYSCWFGAEEADSIFVHSVC
jgi:hypothetical protein